MKRTARNTAGALALLTVVAASGCASGGGSSGDDSLSISWITNEARGVEAVVEAFRAEHPDIDINLNVAETGAYQAALRTELSSGTAADVVYAWSPSNAAGIRTLDNGGFLEDLSDEPWAGDYFDSLIEGAQTEDGRTLLMAPLTAGFSATYNQTALDEAGLQAPNSLDEMWAYCDAAVDQGLTPYAVAGADQYGSHALFMTLAADLVYGSGFQFDEDIASGETTFPTNDSYIQAYELFEEMVDSNCIPDNSSGVSFDELTRQMATGEALGSIGSTMRIGQMQEMNPDAEIRLYRFDSDNDASTNREILDIQGGAAIPANGDNIELAKTFVRFLADNIDLYWSAHPGSAPTMPDKVDVTDDPNSQLLLDILAEGDNVHYLNTYWCPETEAAMVAGNQGIIVGSTTGPAVLESMQTAYDSCG